MLRYFAAIAALLLALTTIVAGPAHAQTGETLIGLIAVPGPSQTFQLIQFNSATPGTIDAQVPITGLPAGEELLGLATGQLYALGRSALYTIFPANGLAVQVGRAPSDPSITRPSHARSNRFSLTSPSVWTIVSGPRCGNVWGTATGR
jgi:hypothetical protein